MQNMFLNKTFKENIMAGETPPPLPPNSAIFTKSAVFFFDVFPKLHFRLWKIRDRLYIGCWVKQFVLLTYCPTNGVTWTLDNEVTSWTPHYHTGNGRVI